MATQQVKFHSVTTEQYNDAGRPLNDGSLYFISDNGEIRKGGKHVTGTRVFKAVDKLTGACSPVESLDIKFEGTSITQESYTIGEGDSAKTFPMEHPKRGDMLVVDHEISMGKHEFSAYIYAANGGEYNASNWQACDGNVDASKVILTQNITMAGNYTNIGNLTKGSDGGKSSTFLEDADGNKIGTDGVSVYDLIKQMLSKTVEPKINANPTVSLSVTNTSYDVEYGITVTPTYSVTYKDGNYKYDGGLEQAAGCKRTSWDVTNVADGTAGSGNVNSIVADASSKSLTVTAKATYDAGTNTPKNNLDENSSIAKIPAGTTAAVSKTVTVTAYRKNFWIVLGHDDMVDLSNVSFDGTNSTLNSDNIRANGHWNKNNFSSLPIANEFQQVLIFLPKSAYQNKVLSAETSKGLPFTVSNGGRSISNTLTIKGAGDDAGVEYSIWEIKTGSPAPADTIKLTWA